MVSFAGILRRGFMKVSTLSRVQQIPAPGQILTLCRTSGGIALQPVSSSSSTLEGDTGLINKPDTNRPPTSLALHWRPLVAQGGGESLSRVVQAPRPAHGSGAAA